MNGSPLNSAFGDSRARQSVRFRWLAFGLFGIAGLASVGSVFAASVSLGTGAVSFTQGVRTIAACDADGIGVSLGAAFDSSPDPAVFVLDEIQLTDVDSGCDNKALTLKIYNGTTLQLTVTGTLNTSSDDTTVSIAAKGDDLDIVADDGSQDTNTYTALDGTEVVEYAASQTSVLVASSSTDITVEIN
mgnify:CR=1 FL=1